MFVLAQQQMLWTGWDSQPADFWRREFTWIQLDISICHIHRRLSLIITASYERSPAPIWSKPHWSHFHPHSFSLTAFSSLMHLLHMQCLPNLFLSCCIYFHLNISRPLFFLKKRRGERRRKMKSMFTQLKMHSNSIWMGATNFLCTIDVLFISVNVVTLRGRIASLNKTGLWAFIRGSHTQRHLRSLGMCRGKKNNSANSSYFNLSVLKWLMNKCNSAKLMKSNDGKRGMILRNLEAQITGWTELQIWNVFTDLTEAFNNYCNLTVKNNKSKI